MEKIKKNIEIIFEKYEKINSTNISKDMSEEIFYIIKKLDRGKLRIAEKKNGIWKTNQWLKKAILLFFHLVKNKIINNSYTKYFDKIPLKFSNWNDFDFKNSNIRVVPNANVRFGAYIAKNSILMPSYVNIGAYVDEGTMVDTWSTVGSCAQIGKNVHLSGGVGIGGVLEPLQANPTIIEDNCFIGARSEIVEGVIIEKNSVISMGVFIGQSTKIYERNTGKIYLGKVPSGSVVVPGNLPSKDGKYSLYCAVIVKKVDNNTLSKIEINKLLREVNE